jgi:hypothetical protein
MKEPIVVIVGDGTGDQPLQLAMQHLCSLSARGLIRRFWYVDANATPDESVLTTRVTAGEVETDPLFRSIAAERHPSVTRAVLVMSAAASEAAITKSLNFFHGLFPVVQRLQPPGVRLKDVRMAFPVDVERESGLSHIFSSYADANLIVLPEDRSSDLGFAAPLSLDDIDGLGAHMAAELATQLGLWLGMEDAPVDDSAAGVIAGNDIPVRFIRSYARAAVGPPLPLREAMTAGESLPVPPRVQQSPNQWVSARDFADRLFDDMEFFHFSRVEVERGKVVGSRLELAKIYFNEGKVYLREIPANLKGSVTDDVGELGGELLQRALGEESRYEVDWIGRDLNEQSTADDHLEAIIDGLNERIQAVDLDSVESTPIDQSNWVRLVRDLAGAVDASDTATSKIVVGGNRLVVNDPTAFGPPVDVEFEECLRLLNIEAVDQNKGTLLGRFAAKIRQEMEITEEFFRQQIGRVRESYAKLTVGRFRPLPVLTWSIGALTTALITALVIGSGLMKSIGVDSWNERTRYIVGLAIALVWLGAAALCLSAAQRIQKGFGRYVPWIVCGGVLAAAFVLWWRIDTFTSTQLRFASAPVKEMIIMGAVAICLLIGIVGAVVARRIGYRAMARLIGILLFSYLSFAVIGILIRGNGWYSQQQQSEVLKRCLQISMWCLLAGIILFLVLLYFRIRHRLQYDATKKKLLDLIASARFTASEMVRLRAVYHQYLGTAIAVNRVVQLPFGNQEVVEFHPPEDSQPFKAYKVSLHYFELEGPAKVGALARIRRLVADQGWITRQYLEGSKAFVPEFAFQTGRDPDEITDLTPEMDQTIGNSKPDFSKAGMGPRWRFAELLYSGSFDEHLERSGIETAMDDALTKFLTPTRSASSESGAMLGISDHGLEIIAGTRPELSASNFGGLATAADTKAQMDAIVWWPEVVAAPDALPARTELRRSKVNQADPRQLVIEFARADWSQKFALSEIPFGPDTVYPTAQKTTSDGPGGM